MFRNGSESKTTAKAKTHTDTHGSSRIFTDNSELIISIMGIIYSLQQLWIQENIFRRPLANCGNLSRTGWLESSAR